MVKNRRPVTIINGRVKQVNRNIMQKPAILILFVTLAGTCLLAGCASTTPPADLTDSPWILVAYEDGGNGLVPVSPSISATLQFRTDGQLEGNAGCNDYFGSYRVEGGLLSIGQVGSTEKYCLSAEGIMEFEQRYLSLLKETTRYNIDGTELTLSYYDERKLLVFKKG
jgi:heat shock protein HslJ